MRRLIILASKLFPQQAGWFPAHYTMHYAREKRISIFTYRPAPAGTSVERTATIVSERATGAKGKWVEIA